jgi:hypothetical protein
MEGAGCVGESAQEGKFGRVGRQIVHRGCTGNAERQWPVVSDQSLSIRCTGVEEFSSGIFRRRNLRDGQRERSQPLGAGGERKGLCKVVSENKFQRGGVDDN